MPVEYDILPEHNLAVYHYRGQIRYDEFVQSLLEMARQPEFVRGINLLSDMSQCEFENVTFADMQDLIYRLGEYIDARDTSARTLIFAPDDITFGMLRMYQMLAEDRARYEICVFRDLDEGFPFLGIDPASPLAADLRRRVEGRTADQG